jgi:hypothetical protein
MKLKGNWNISREGEFFVLYSPSGAKKGEFASQKEAIARMNRIKALKRASKEVGKEDKKKFFEAKGE